MPAAAVSPNSENLVTIMGVLLGRALDHLTGQVVMPMLVNTDLGKGSQEQWDTVNVEVYDPGAPKPVVPATTAPTPQGRKARKVPVQLKYWEYDDFALTDEEIAKIENIDRFLPRQAQMAVEGLAQRINATLYDGYKKVYLRVGTPGTTPFERIAATGVPSADHEDNLAAVKSRVLCAENSIPESPIRNVVLDPMAEANLGGLPGFAESHKVGDGGQQVRTGGTQGRRLWGFDWYWDNQVQTHTAGVPGGTPAVATNTSASATEVPLDGGGAAGTYVEGDVIKFAGHSQTYVVTEALELSGTGTGTVKISPPLVAAVEDGDLVTLDASHVVNLGFHPNAYAFAMRSLKQMNVPGWSMIAPAVTLQHPKSGLVMRLQIMRQFMQTAWFFDCLWAAELVDPRLAWRISG
jgi:hypothetical protein